MIFKGDTQEYLQLETIESENHPVFNEKLPSGLTILWNKSERALLQVDGVEHELPKDHLIFLTEFHQLKPLEVISMRVIRFNRSFYCIVDHDSEVSCKGLLFFGNSNVPVIELTESERSKFEILWNMFEMEINSPDNLQLEMLQSLLKRLLILGTRVYKNQFNLQQVVNKKMNLIREFYYQVEKHFKEHKDVAFYAAKMNRSPKTLSNIFLEMEVTPLQVIQERILLEARRQLHYTDLSVKEITYALGFEDIQSFSRFFKSKEKQSPVNFRITSRMNKKEEKLLTHWVNLPTSTPIFQANFVGKIL